MPENIIKLIVIAYVLVVCMIVAVRINYRYIFPLKKINFVIIYYQNRIELNCLIYYISLLIKIALKILY